VEAQSLHPFRIEALTQRAQDAAFTDARVTAQQHHLTFAVICLRPPAKQQIQFLRAADQRG
jgi:hypothetical protein